MMNSYRRNDGSRTRLLVVTVVVVIVFSVDWLSGGFVRGFIRGGAVATWQTGSGIIRSIGASGFFSSRKAVVAENEALKQELSRLGTSEIEVKALREENDALRRLVRLAAREPGITAPIISSVISSPYGTFVIGAGNKDNVSKGDLVLAGGEDNSVVVGRVDEVSERRSLVREIFAPGANMAVTIRGAQFDLEGKGGGNAYIKVPATLSVDVGDIVIAPDLGGRLVGLVGAVNVDKSATYKDVFLRGAVSMSDLRFVYVITAK